MVVGIAKPMPIEPPLREKIAVLMPTSLPFESTSAPPELPGLIAASVWMKFSYVLMPRFAAAQRRDDAHRHGLADAERVADGEHHVTHLQRVRAAEGDRRQVARLDFQHSKVAFGVSADQLGFELAAIRERHRDLVGGLNDMVVGQYEAILGRHYARTQAGNPVTAAGVAKEISIQRIIGRTAPAYFFGCVHVDHGGRRQLDCRAVGIECIDACIRYHCLLDAKALRGRQRRGRRARRQPFRA